MEHFPLIFRIYEPSIRLPNKILSTAPLCHGYFPIPLQSARDRITLNTAPTNSADVTHRLKLFRAINNKTFRELHQKITPDIAAIFVTRPGSFSTASDLCTRLKKIPSCFEAGESCILYALVNTQGPSCSLSGARYISVEKI